MRCLSALACIVLAFNPAFACESPPAAEAFVYENDMDLDGVLDMSEWKNVKSMENFRVKFGDFSKAEFKKFDKNKDGKLEWESELEGNIEYIKDPCEIKEEQENFKKSKSNQKGKS
ncbi:hypothetical protein [Campylobacter sp. RM16192]|uniref:hypothetical protein n=1 Tax=Campylobacter sp. RM16192 TaxID=1660080 RepID=UPI0014528546|nr:hypothetical protein [Campylobacter sp. RM16192]QCD52434.1 hypothetical protein CDOMC_0808 [Campylobacter sp. RM16192]